MEDNEQGAAQPVVVKAKRRVVAWAFAATGLLGGGMLVGALPALAQTPTTESTPDAGADSDGAARDREDCPDKAAADDSAAEATSA